MNPIPSLKRPASATRGLCRSCERLFSTSLQQQEASYRRARSRLNIKPDASFLPSKTEAHDHIIFNPPPSAPNVYHTPTIFLPKTDRRRQLFESSRAQDPQLEAQSQQRLPPAVVRPYEKRYHVTAEQMEEMRQLRREDPMKWSVAQLAKKFDCSGIFVSFVTEKIAKEKKEQQKRVTDAVKSRWGVKRRAAREDRALRRERWYSDS